MSREDWIRRGKIGAKFTLNIKDGGVGRRTGRGGIRSFSLSAGLDFPDLIVLEVLRLIKIHIFIFQRLKAALHYTVGRICEKAGKLCM